MTTDPIAAALDHIRSITPANLPWTPTELAMPGLDPTPTKHAIATILNAVVSGELICRPSRDEMLAQVRRGEVFATAGAEARWIADSEAGAYCTDAPDPIAAARALIEPLTGYTPGPWSVSEYDGTGYVYGPAQGYDDGFDLEDARLIAAAPDLRDMVATLADALEAERAKAKAERLVLKAPLEGERATVAVAYEAAADFVGAHATFERSACEPVGPNLDPPLSPVGMAEREIMNTARERTASTCETMALAIRYLTPADAKAALNKLLGEARLEGWRAGRDAAANSAETVGFTEVESPLNDGLGTAVFRPVRGYDIAAIIRALPEPEEDSHED